MSDDLIPFAAGGGNLPDRNRSRGPYNSPHWLTEAGQIDRRKEHEHVVAVRQAVRDVEMVRLQVAQALARDFAELDAHARRLTEQKFHLHRAHKESEILGADDAELRAKFAVLDDDQFARFRQMGLGGSR